MEVGGIIARTVHPEVPLRVEYSLSDLGESMRPIMKTMEILILKIQRYAPLKIRHFCRCILNFENFFLKFQIFKNLWL